MFLKDVLILVTSRYTFFAHFLSNIIILVHPSFSPREQCKYIFLFTQGRESDKLQIYMRKNCAFTKFKFRFYMSKVLTKIHFKNFRHINTIKNTI